MSGPLGKAPDFWWHEQPNWQAWALSGPAALYGHFSGNRILAKPSGQIHLPVVCVGNFVLGGAGKTPFSLRLADSLEDGGQRPGYLLRGYGGKEKGPLLVDPARHTAADVGDEALLLAERAPTVVSADRVAGGQFAEGLTGENAIDILIMDDGFQNPALHKDLSLVLVDAETGIGNGLCFPAGPLRAPLARQIVKMDALVIVGSGGAADEVIHQASRKGLPFFHARLQARSIADLQGRGVLAYAGIGRPEKFFKSLQSAGHTVVRSESFPDHHIFSQAEAQRLLTSAEDDDLQLVTTSKDMARLAHADGEIFRWLAARSKVLEVDMVIEQEERLLALINEMRRRRVFRQAPA